MLVSAAGSQIMLACFNRRGGNVAPQHCTDAAKDANMNFSLHSIPTFPIHLRSVR